MKLKLESQETATILTVTESIEPSHLPILKAGLTKLFQSGKKAIILDFTQVTENDFKDPALFQQIADLRSWATASDAQVIVLSELEKMGHAKNRAEAMELLTSPVGQILALEAKLQAQLKALEQKKAVLVQKLGGSQAGELMQLQQQNSRLKKNIEVAERLSRRFLKLRNNKEPYKIPETQVKQENLEKLVDSFLKQEALLP